MTVSRWQVGMISALSFMAVGVASSHAEIIGNASQELIQLEARIFNNPNNLDLYFQYAKLAKQVQNQREEEWAYRSMLKLNPLLHRIKLDLALLHMQMGKTKSAEALFTKVLAQEDIPLEVETNVKAMLKNVKKMNSPHRLTGSVTAGYNHDTNANTAPGTGEIIFQDINIPLDDASQSQDDGQGFVAVSIGHSYRFDVPEKRNYQAKWNTSATVYRAEQIDIDSLNLLLIGVKTGPEWYLKDSKVNLKANAGFSYVNLDNRDYLNIYSLDARVSKQMTDRLNVFTEVLGENRRFKNTPTNTTFSDRSGNAIQAKAGAHYVLVANGLLTIEGIYRRENTRTAYNDNDQVSVVSSYTHSLPKGFFVNLQGSMKNTSYDGVDPLVSATTIRDDDETSYGVTVGNRITDKMTVTAGYQYRDVESNLQNYTYDNHRFSSAVSLRF
jgi:hypothetical protein